MKKILTFIVLLAGVMAITSCSNDDATYTPTPVLEVASADLSFEATGGTGTVVVNNPAGTLTATTESSWLGISVNGNTLTITAEPNSVLEGRSATILLKAGNTENTITATQKGCEYGLSSLEVTLADVANSSANVGIVHTEDVSVSTETSWLQATFDAANNTIVITATESNDEDAERVGSVIVSSGTIKETITVTQSGLLLVLGKEEITAANAASKVAIPVEHSRDVTVTSECDWLTATFDATKNVIDLTVAENTSGDPRIGYITVTSGPAVRTFTVTQYEFESAVESLYLLVFYDTSLGGWNYYTAQIADDKLSFLYPATSTVTLQYDIPVEINAETESLAAGPCSSFIGKYGANYWIYLVFRSASGYWTGYTNTTSMANGSISFEEEEGETTTYIDWGGTFGNQSIDGWGLRAMSAEGFSEDNNVGYLTTLYYPYMIRVGNNAASRRSASAQPIKSRGHIVYPATAKTGFEN